MAKNRRVTDHAVLRYLDRVLGVDVEQLRQLIADGTARHSGAPCVRGMGARFMLQEGRVITVFGERELPKSDVLRSILRNQEAR